ncbi:MAG: TonB-dependent receptor [Tannerella sp.]|jgi:TonB-linked SusC/RagA family outer membrane protein|nr:TonB-dependent receptor [Tannerella sp.]
MKIYLLFREKIWAEKWMKTFCLCLFLVSASTILATSEKNAFQATRQATTVRGTVVDETGEPIIGANIKVTGTSAGTITDLNGRFTLSVPADGKLEISYIGYTSQVVNLPANGEIRVVLKEDTLALSEVVVVGYGTQKKAHLTGSIATVNPDELKEMPYSNMGAMLAGTVAGLSVSGGDGRPGVGASITIRDPFSTKVTGASTAPIYVIDGMIQQDNPRNGISAGEAFNNLDPNEIESISILKDAAAAVYGARGAQGAIIVTTKKGNVNGSPRISYSGSVTVNNEISRPSMLNAYEYGTFFNGFTGGSGNSSISNHKTDLFQADELEAMRGINYDWLEKAWSSAYSTKHNVNISGGGQGSSYFGSVSYQSQEGNLSTSDYGRWNYRAGMNTTLAGHLKVGLSVSGDYADRKTTFNKIGGEKDDNDYLALLTTPRYMPWSITDDNGNELWLLRNGIDNSNPSILGNSNYARYNFFAIEDLANMKQTKSQNMTINGSLEYDFDWLEALKGLKLRFNYAKTISNTEGRQLGSKYDAYYFTTRGGSGNHLYIDEGAPDDNLTLPSNIKLQSVDNGNRVLRDFDRTDNYQMNFQASYARDFGKHSVSALFAVEKREMNYDFSRIIKESPLSGGLANGETNTTTGGIDGQTQRSESGDLSYIGRVNYAYDSRYLFEFLIRSDASTKFSPDNYWGVFPSVSVGWIVSEEEWFKSDWMDYLKIRTSFGMLGQDNTAAWLWRQRYTYQLNYGAIFGTAPGNSLGWALKTEAAPNYDAHWDKNYKYNTGFDMRFLNGRLSAGIDAYLDKRTDMLVARSGMPVTVGAKSAAENYDAVDNYGIELSLGWRDKVSDFNYSVQVNGQWRDARYRKKDWPTVLTFEDVYPDGPTDMGQWGYDCMGMFRSQAEIDEYVAKYGITKYRDLNPNQIKPGMLIYRDIRGDQNPDGSYKEADGIVDDKDKIKLAKRKSNPYGTSLLLGAGWKGVTFNANISASWGGYASSLFTNAFSDSDDLKGASMPSFWKDMFVAEDILDDQGRVVAEQNLTGKYPNMKHILNKDDSDFWQVDAFRMYLRNVSLGYTLPRKWLGKVGVESCKLSLTGTNLFSFYNPYPDQYTDPLTVYGTFPTLRSWTMGLHLSF